MFGGGGGEASGWIAARRLSNLWAWVSGSSAVLGEVISSPCWGSPFLRGSEEPDVSSGRGGEASCWIAVSRLSVVGRPASSHWRGGMAIDGGLKFADAPEQVLLAEEVVMLHFLVFSEILGLCLLEVAPVGREDLTRLPRALGCGLPVEFLADDPVDVREVLAAGGAGAAGDLNLAEELEMLDGVLDRGDAAGVDGVGDLPVGSFG